MDRPLRTKLHSTLQAEQVQVLYHNMPTGMLANAVNAGILTLVEWPVVPHQSLLLWVIVMCIAAAARALLVFNYRRAVPS